MATKDLRFFDSPDAPALPDGFPRRGMSVVAALSTWLVHTNHRHQGSWTQRYERGVPTTGLLPVPDAGNTGTSVHFMPDTAVLPSDELSADEIRAISWGGLLTVDVLDERSPGRASPPVRG